jgi:hypothetical protein
MVQMCLGDEKGAALFMSTMKGIAQSQNMAFIDGSRKNQEDLVQLKVSPNYRLIDIGIERKDGVGLSAGNVGLSAYEVAIGFSEGSNPVEAHQFTDVTVGTLKQAWDVHVVPSGQGAFPLKGCSSSAAKHGG